MKFVDKYHSSISHLVKMRTAVKSSFWYLPEGRYMEKSSALVFLGENPSLPINSTEPMICALELHWEQSLSKRQVLADTVPEWKLTQVLTSLSERKKTLLLSKIGGGGEEKKKEICKEAVQLLFIWSALISIHYIKSCFISLFFWVQCSWHPCSVSTHVFAVMCFQSPILQWLVRHPMLLLPGPNTAVWGMITLLKCNSPSIFNLRTQSRAWLERHRTDAKLMFSPSWLLPWASVQNSFRYNWCITANLSLALVT